MPFIEHYRDKAPGLWVTIGVNPDNKKDVRVKVRNVPAHVQDHNDKTYNKSKPGKARRISVDEGMANASYGWVDCENFDIQIMDDAGARVFSEELGKPVKVGDTVVLDGKLTEKIKWELFQSNTGVYVKIVSAINKVENRNLSEDEELQENLSSGSDSD